MSMRPEQRRRARARRGSRQDRRPRPQQVRRRGRTATRGDLPRCSVGYDGGQVLRPGLDPSCRNGSSRPAASTQGQTIYGDKTVTVRTVLVSVSGVRACRRPEKMAGAIVDATKSISESQSWSDGSKSHVFATTIFPHKYTTMRPHTEPGYVCKVAKLPSLAAAGAPKVPSMLQKQEHFDKNLTDLIQSSLPVPVKYPQFNQSDPQAPDTIPISLIPAYPYRFEVTRRNGGPHPRTARAARRARDGSSTTPFFVDYHYADDEQAAPYNRQSAAFCPPSRATHPVYSANSRAGIYGYTRGALQQRMGFSSRPTTAGQSFSALPAHTFVNGRFV